MGIPKVSIAIPASIVVDVPGLQMKTYKIGQVGRVAAIYRVEEIYVYPDHNYGKQEGDIELVYQVLLYMETPQYLRKRLFPLSRVLKYAGALPPLNTPHHPTNSLVATLENGEFREGVVVSCGKTGSLIDVGVEKPLRTLALINEGTRGTFRVKKEGEKVSLDPSERSKPTDYWGYRVHKLREQLGTFLKRRGFDLQILTSRSGSPMGDLIEELVPRLQSSGRILLSFGSPKEGLKQILSREGLGLSIADYVLNTVPGQGTSSVRTEEAIHASLATINLLAHWGRIGRAEDS
nr:putative RNA uridine N3 methyltransferase [Candidatus Njordarchaeota archaeon]